MTGAATMPSRVKIARIYIRVSTDEQDLARQAALREGAERAGFYVAAVYAEKASGARVDRPELLRMIADLQPGEVVIAEHSDRITRLPLDEAIALVDRIRAAGATLSVPGLVDLADVVTASQGVTKIVLEAVQELLLKILLQMARDNYETMRRRQLEGIALAKGQGKYKGGRKADKRVHARIVALRKDRHSIAETARLAGCSAGLVKLVWRRHQEQLVAAAASTLEPSP
jgi:DNA invertase Pin-like site-specific DNA recombinase